MNSTALVTFLLQTPPSIYTVELLGSWDNFSRPYRLERDIRLGRGYWRGCPSFSDIICDGDTETSTPRRDGGLKMGGTYWYFYRLNGDVEFCNNAEPSTMVCPFLPGQEVNLLEVPTQAGPPRNIRPNGSSSSLGSAVFTLDPQHKYRRLPISVCKPAPAIEGRTTPILPSAQSCMQLSKGDGNKASEEDPCSVPKSSWKVNKDRLNLSGRAPNQFSLMAAYYRMRGIRSAEYQRGSKGTSSLLDLRRNMYTSTARTPESFERATKSAYEESSVQIKGAGSPVYAAPMITSSTNLKKSQGALAEVCFCSTQLQLMPAKLNVPPNTLVQCRVHSARSDLATSPRNRDFQLDLRPRSRKSISLSANGQKVLDGKFAAPSNNGFNRSIGEQDSNLAYFVKAIQEELLDPHKHTQTSSVDEPADDVFSPSLELSTVRTGSLSPSCLSEPQSPLWPEFDQQYKPHDHELNNDHKCPAGLDYCRPNYSLPSMEQTLALSIQPSQPSIVQTLDAESSYLNSCNLRHRVHAWDDKSEHQRTALEELVDDLGYLGEAII